MRRTLENGRTPRPSRRQVLAAAGIGATAGCLDRVRSTANRDPPEPVSVTIKTMPADDDPFSIRFARTLAENLEAAGIGAEVLPMETQEFLLSVLLNTDFDVYVARTTVGADPDGLRPFLHSRFVGEPGWQNPFGYTSLDADELLEEQRRRSGGTRRQTVFELQRTLMATQPFRTVAVPNDVNAVRTDRFAGWSRFGVASPLTYLAMEPPEDGDDEVRVVLTDARPTRNLNPLAVEFRGRGLFVGLIYESLGRHLAGDVRPWLAREWSWTDEEAGGETRPVATVSLRDDVRWHDGEPVTADDLVFTYRFLADTSLGDVGDRVPAPAYRGRSSLVSEVEALDRRTVRIDFVPSSVPVAKRALTLPILPRHDWEGYSRQATIAGIDVAEDTTAALVRENLAPVGCGPFEVVEVVADTAVVLRRWEGHFLGDDDEAAGLAGGRGADRIEVQVVPSAAAGVELLRAGQADAIASRLAPPEIATVGRSDGISLRVRRSNSFYHVGYNNRRAPFSNPRFRRVVSRLLDSRRMVGEVFSGFAAPAKTPLSGGAWGDDDALPSLTFLGSEGEVDVEQCRAAFREIGYRYNDDGQLLLN